MPGRGRQSFETSSGRSRGRGSAQRGGRSHGSEDGGRGRIREGDIGQGSGGRRGQDEFRGRGSGRGSSDRGGFRGAGGRFEGNRGRGRGRGSSERGGGGFEGNRGGGRGRGPQGDEMLSLEQAQEYMTGEINKVFQARPTDFFRLPEDERKTPSGPEFRPMGLALRPNHVNEIVPIWKQVKVELNYFKIESRSSVAYQYDLQVHRLPRQQPLESRGLYQKVFRQLQIQLHWPSSTIHDGKKTVWDLNKDLPNLLDFELPIDNGRKKVYVTFKFVKELDMSQLQHNILMENIRDVGWLFPIECIRVLDAAIRQGALYDMDRYAVRGRQVVDLHQPGVGMEADEAYEVLMGYRESVRVVTEGLVLNLNTVYNMAKKGAKIIDFLKVRGIQDFSQPLLGRDLRQANEELQGTKVRFTVKDLDGKEQKRLPKIKGLAEVGANECWFPLENGEQTNVEKYFKQKYGYRIMFPSFNLVECQNGSKLPIECCSIHAGQFEKAEKKLQAELIRKAAKIPTARFKDINKGVGNVSDRIKDDPAKFWIKQIEKNWIQGKGFQVPPPVVEYNQLYVKPHDGAWQGWKAGNNRQMEFHPYMKTIRIESYGVLSFIGENEAVDFCISMVEFGNNQVMKGKVAEFDGRIIVNGGEAKYLDTETAVRLIQQVEKRAEKIYNKKPQIIFILFPARIPQYFIMKAVLEGNDPNTSKAIKVPSQVVVIKAYKKGEKDYAYLKMLMLKVNEKVGGGNFRIAGGYQSLPAGPKPFSQLKQSREWSSFFPCMFMGADVTHPSPQDTQVTTSIAAIVASVDLNLTRYAARIRSQKGKQENIVDMYNCTGSLVDQFRQQNGLPQSIIMYRDGVSEGQFDQVLTQEYKAMRAALQQFGDENYYPKIMFVIVQKRHHTRPRPVDMEASDKKGNLVPGIVIDKDGCHPFEFQFYLNSHATIQGTNRPALYTVLVDEIGFGAEQFYLLTNWITYTYQRCPRSVSIPPPAYYAHHVCTRGRILENQGCTAGMVVAGLEPKMYWI